MRKTILIAAAGTGGHIFPALAVANNLAKDYKILWLGTHDGLEKTIVKDYPIHIITAVGIRGTNFKNLIIAPFKISYAVLQTISIIIKYKVALTIGFGGFIAGIAGIATFLTTKKLIIHEQNAIVGTANRYLQFIATKSYTGFNNVLKNAIFCGNPIIWSAYPKRDNGNNRQLNILVIGGSLGAQAINEIMPQLNIQANIFHQTGKGNLAQVKELYVNNKKSANIFEFINDMAKYYALADLIICRSGAMTISELIKTKSVAILIPLPSAIDNHQFYNAKILVDNNCAIMLEQKNLNVANMTKIINNMNIENIGRMRNNFNNFRDINSLAIIKQGVASII